MKPILNGFIIDKTIILSKNMDHEETDNSNDPSTSKMQQENQKEEAAIAKNNNQTNIPVFKSEPGTSTESPTVQKLPLYDSTFASYRYNVDFPSDKESSESSDENSLCEFSLENEHDFRVNISYPHFNEKISSVLDLKERLIYSHKKTQDKYERMVEKINKIILEDGTCKNSGSSDNSINMTFSSDERSVLDCNTSQENKQSTSEKSRFFPSKLSEYCTNILKLMKERKENSSMTIGLGQALIQYPESSHSNTFYKTDKGAENSPSFSPDKDCPAKFTHSRVLEHFPSASKNTRDWHGSNMLTWDNSHGNKEKTLNSSNSQDCKEKLSRSWEGSSNSCEFTPFSPNHNKRIRKSFELNSDDSETSSDDAKRNFPRNKGTQKRRKIAPFNASDSSKHDLTFPRAGSNENVSEGANTSHKRNSEEKSERSKGKKFSKNVLRSLEIINSGNIDVTRKRHVSSDESEDVEKREADRKQSKKLRYRTSSEK